MVGYADLHLPIKSILANRQQTFHLRIKPTELESVVWVAGKLVEKKFGIKQDPGLIQITDGSVNQNDIFEIAQLIRLDSTVCRITSVNLHIAHSRKDSSTFRINFYRFDGNKPGERIIEKTILEKKEIKEGWLTFDLKKHNVYLEGIFIVAIEFIPSEQTRDQIYYDIKLGGSSKSFVRKSSQGEWTVPPHHYRLFITALVKDKKSKKKPDDDEERESVPATTMFSETVKDSFSIFINLPAGYSEKKEQNFPVYYLLDANLYFDIVSDLVKVNKSPAILVGIGYKNIILMDSLRNRDYTFPKALPEDSFATSGGAPLFLSFLRNELLPYIDHTYRTDTTSRTLMGHSLGGYFTLFAFEQSILGKDNSFQNYVAASPSLHYCNRFLMNRYQNISTSEHSQKKSLLITIGGLEDKEDGEMNPSGSDNFNSLVNLLSQKKFRSIILKSEYYPYLGHMETALPTFTKSIREMK